MTVLKAAMMVRTLRRKGRRVAVVYRSCDLVGVAVYELIKTTVGLLSDILTETTAFGQEVHHTWIRRGILTHRQCIQRNTATPSRASNAVAGSVYTHNTMQFCMGKSLHCLLVLPLRVYSVQ
jgi:hypothetical protein